MENAFICKLLAQWGRPLPLECYRIVPLGATIDARLAPQTEPALRLHGTVKFLTETLSYDLAAVVD